MEKYNVSLFGFNDNNELDFTKHKIMYKQDKIFHRARKDCCISMDRNNFLMIIDHNQAAIITKAKKRYNEQITECVPYINKNNHNVTYSIYIPLLVDNKEILAYYACDQYLFYKNKSKDDLYNEEYINVKYLDLFFNKITAKHFIRLEKEMC